MDQEAKTYYGAVNFLTPSKFMGMNRHSIEWGKTSRGDHLALKREQIHIEIHIEIHIGIHIENHHCSVHSNLITMD